MRSLALLGFVAGMIALGPLVLADPAERLEVKLDVRPITPGSIKTVLGVAVRAETTEAPPEGFDFVYRMPGGKGSLFQKTDDSGKTCLFMEVDSGFVPLPDCPAKILGNTVVFGPARIGPGSPAFTAHVYLARGKGQKSPGFLYVMPAEILAGVVEIGGKMVRIGLIDANLDGDCSDPCIQHLRSGDWFAVDLDGDAEFLIDQNAKEGRALTRCIELGGRTWSWKVEDSRLLLEPARMGICQVRIDGLEEEAEIYGWSEMTGMFRTKTREDGSFEIPDAGAQVYNYTLVSGEWKVVGSLGVKGRIKAPGAGMERIIRAGPPMTGTLTNNIKPDGSIQFNAKLTGKAGESFTLYHRNKRASAAVLVVLGPDGAEVLRKVMGHG